MQKRMSLTKLKALMHDYQTFLAKVQQKSQCYLNLGVLIGSIQVIAAANMHTSIGASVVKDGSSRQVGHGCTISTVGYDSPKES